MRVFGYATFPPLPLWTSHFFCLSGIFLLEFFNSSIFAGMDVVSEIKEESPPPWAADGCEYTPSVTC
jgi:hypothetical protein